MFRAVRGAGDRRQPRRQGRRDDRLLGGEFFWLRQAHAVVYWLAIPFVRTLVFALGFVAVAGVFREVITS